tara:strand:- start:376 stop:783 length:408 start_codon:yes stop_codon:yes gene_type:complete
MNVVLSLQTGTIDADTRRAHEDPPQAVVAWSNGPAVSIAVRYIIGVTDAAGPSMDALDPTPSTVCVEGMGSLTVREPREAIELAMIGFADREPGVYVWLDTFWARESWSRDTDGRLLREVHLPGVQKFLAGTSNV